MARVTLPVELALAMTAAPACITPSVLESSGRAVEVAPAELAWRPAVAEDLRGLWESVAIEGEAAASLWRVYYHFASDGTYTGAALVIGGAQPEFQTLSGSWTLADGVLDLGEGNTARASVAALELRLQTDGGTAILRQAAVQ
jgi:hypothetical protein